MIGLTDKLHRLPKNLKSSAIWRGFSEKKNIIPVSDVTSPSTVRPASKALFAEAQTAGRSRCASTAVSSHFKPTFAQHIPLACRFHPLKKKTR